MGRVVQSSTGPLRMAVAVCNAAGNGALIVSLISSVGFLDLLPAFLHRVEFRTRGMLLNSFIEAWRADVKGRPAHLRRSCLLWPPSPGFIHLSLLSLGLLLATSSSACSSACHGIWPMSPRHAPLGLI